MSYALSCDDPTFRRVCMVARNVLQLRLVRLSACMSATPLDGFPRNLVSVKFLKICRENPNLFKIEKKNYRELYVKNRYVSC